MCLKGWGFEILLFTQKEANFEGERIRARKFAEQK